MTKDRKVKPGEIELLDEDCWSPTDELYAEVMSLGGSRQTRSFEVDEDY